MLSLQAFPYAAAAFQQRAATIRDYARARKAALALRRSATLSLNAAAAAV